MTQTASGGRDGNAARSRAAKSDAALAKLRVWLTRIRSHAFWVNLTSPRTIWHGMIFIFGWIYTLLVKLPWAIAVVVIATIVFQGLTQHATVIKPISVPKDLADSGYTAEVAGQRLRDAMAEYMGNIHAHKRSPDIALHGELPSIMVPTVGISLDAIVSSVRTLLRSTRSRTIGGEITVRDKLLWLSLRLDDQRFYVSKNGVDPNKPDELFTAAVQDVITNIDPYFVAFTLRQQDPDRALKFVDEMLAKLPESDENVPWLYSMRDGIYWSRKEFPAATAALQTAIHLNGRLSSPHLNLGVVYADQNKYDEAGVEYRRAIELEPNYALSHNNYGDLLLRQHKYAEAKVEIDKALALDKNLAIAHTTLGEIFRDTGQRSEAVAEFTEALRLNPKSASARRELDKLIPEPTATGTVPQK